MIVIPIALRFGKRPSEGSDGDTLCAEVASALDSGASVTVEFGGTECVSFDFLRSGIANLWRRFSVKVLGEKLSLVGLRGEEYVDLSSAIGEVVELSRA